MNKRHLVITLVIVLVCLNWFRNVLAQDLDQLSDADRIELLDKIVEQKAKVKGTSSYRTPPIFDSESDEAEAGRDLFGAETDSLAEEAVEPEDTVSLLPELTAFEDLRPFGLDMFQGPSEFSPPDDIASSPDYRLGPGDNLIVTLWGQVEKEYVLTIDREGKIFVPRVGEVVAWGKSLREFRVDLKDRFGRIYGDFKMNISLGKIRSIRVYLTGEVERPGAYTVTSLTSLFNALYLAGGPGENGSMRKIQLKRSGKTVGQVDLYKFLLEGNNASDYSLETGDAIHVPIVGPRVAVRGAVRREAVYELKGSQTASEIIRLAGGATAEAYLSRVMLERIAQRDEWEVLDIDLTHADAEQKVSYQMFDGDRLTVYSVSQIRNNMVSVFGQVIHPGYFERNDSSRVSDLIERARLQEYDVYFERANLFRRHADWRSEVIAVDLNQVMLGSAEADILLQDGDSLHVYAISEVNWERYVYIEGKVKAPGQYPLYDGMTVEDLIFLAGSVNRGASMVRAEIARFDSLGNVVLHRVDLGDLAARRTVLTEDDRVYIRQIPRWQLHRTIELEGEVEYPGEYILSHRNETLFDLITRAGGLTDLAFPQGTVLERRSITNSLERMKIPQLLERSSPVIQDSLGHFTRTVLVEFDSESMNRIVLDVESLLATNGEIGNVTLEPGDRIFVPTRPSGISVLGAVGSNGTINFHEKKNVEYYVKRAGNFTSESNKKGVRLIKANGEVFSGKGALKQRVHMGDVVVVPTKIHRRRNWTQTVATVLTTTTGVLTTILLIDRL